MVAVGKAARNGDFVYGIGGGQKHIFGFVKTQKQKIRFKAYPCGTFEQARKIVLVIVKLRRYIGKSDIGREVFRYIFERILDGLRSVAGAANLRRVRVTCDVCHNFRDIAFVKQKSYIAVIVEFLLNFGQRVLYKSNCFGVFDVVKPGSGGVFRKNILYVIVGKVDDDSGVRGRGVQCFMYDSAWNKYKSVFLQ